MGAPLSIIKSVDQSVLVYVQQDGPVKQLVDHVVQTLLDRPI